MSSIAKIFIVLNLLLAALVVGWASNHLDTVDNYKAEVATLQQAMDDQLAEKDTEISGLKTERTELQGSRDGLRNENERLTTDLERANADLSAEKKSNADLGAAVSEIQQTLAGYAEANTSLQDKLEAAMDKEREAVAARHEAEQAQEDAMAAKAQAESSLTAAQDEIRSLSTQVAGLGKDLGEATTQLDIMRDTFDVDAAAILKTPLITGAILSVDNSITPGLVAINKGSADNVKRGFVFDVFSGSSYKGRIKVETVQDNMCVGTIISTYEGRTISSGDTATTKI